MLDDLPFRVGPQPTTTDERLDVYDSMPGEFRDDELEAGAVIPHEEVMLPIPAPRPRQGQPPTSNDQTEFV